jgi:hypothetical protein
MAASLLVVVGLLLMPLNNDYRALWYRELLDALHVPLFAGLALSIGWLLRPGPVWPALVGAALLTGLSEFVQPFVGRSASWNDLAYGLIGVGIAGLLLAGRLPLVWRLAGVALLLAVPLARTLPVTLDALAAWRAFPVLAEFERPLEQRRWWLQRAEMAIEAGGGAVLLCEPSPHGSGAILLPIVRDWSGYEALEIDFAFDGEPLLFLISVRDGKKLPPEMPRFDLWKRYPAGNHQVRIDLAELARGGKFPPIELDRVQSLHLIAYSDQPRAVRVARIALSGKVSRDK